MIPGRARFGADRDTRLALAVVLIAGVQLALELWQLGRGLVFVVSHLTIDDTYYYLQTAWHTRELGFVTFDGLHPTNGVQLLWFVVTWLVAQISPSREFLLFAVLSIAALCNVACHGVLWKIGRMLGRPEVALCLAALWMAVSLGPIYSQGLENSLHGLVFWWALAQTLGFLLALERGDPAPALVSLTIPLIAITWVRLDAGLFAAVFYAGCVGALFLRCSDAADFVRRHGRAVLASASLAAAAFAIQLGAWWSMGGSLLPVSVLVKSSGLHYPPTSEGLARLLEILPMSVPPRFPPLWAGGALAVGLVVAAPLRWKRAGPVERACLRAWGLLLAGFVLYHGAILILEMPYPRYFSWYRTPLFVFWVVTVAGALVATFGWIGRSALVPATAVSVAFSLAVGAATAVDFRRFVRKHEKRRTYLTDLYEGARLLSEQASGDTRLAAWNSGVLAYFAERPTINLDGLVNSVDYYERVLGSPDRIEATRAYLRDERVDYVVDVAETDEVRVLTDGLFHVRSFTEPGEWTGWQMWRVRPDAPPLAPSGAGPR